MLFRDALSPKEATFLGLNRLWSVTRGKMTRTEGWEEDRQRFWQGRLTSINRKREGASRPKSGRRFLRWVERQGDVELCAAV